MGSVPGDLGVDGGFDSTPMLNFAIWLWMFVSFSNCQPISRELQLQYPQLKIQGPFSVRLFGSGFIELVANGAVQIGQLKQFLVHLYCQISFRFTPNALKDEINHGLPTSLPHSSPWWWAFQRDSWGSTSIRSLLSYIEGILFAGNLRNTANALEGITRGLRGEILDRRFFLAHLPPRFEAPFWD